MRNLILVFAVIIMIVSCNKDKNSNKTGIVIKGRITGAITKGASTKGGDVLALSDAKKIFVIHLDNGALRSEFIDITDGTFTATSEIGMATALVFLDANNKYIGTLSSRGLNLLPLNNLSEGENTSIDLADLTLSGSIVVPSHDPLGNEIIISDDEINRLKDIDGFFETLAKNIDADNDNIIDAISNKQLFLKTRFWVQASHWGLNDSPPLMSDIDVNNLGYQLELDGDMGFSLPHSIVLSGPEGNPYNDISTQFINPNGNGGFYSGILRSGGLFAMGTYSVAIEDTTYTLDYANIDAKQNQLFVLPTLNTNSEGKVVSIKLDYRLPDGSPVDPLNILTDVMIQFSDVSGNQYFNSPRMKNEGASLSHCNCISGVFLYTPDVPVDISYLNKIIVAYNDLLGNTYFINWSK